jgi:hypothetical protein
MVGLQPASRLLCQKTAEQLAALVSSPGRYFILDLLSVSAAFDGHLSRLERYHLPQAFGKYTEIYMLRIEALKHALLNGRLHKAKQLCNLDFEPG